MYSLEDLLHTQGKDSATSKPCVWVKRPTCSTKPCKVQAELIIEKGKLPSDKKRKIKHEYCQKIQVDVRANSDQRPDVKRLKRFRENKQHV